MSRVGLANLGLYEDVAVLGSAAGTRDVKLREAVEVAYGAPSGVALIVSVVGSRLRHTERKGRSDEDISSLVCAKHRINFRSILRTSKSCLSCNQKQDGERKTNMHVNGDCILREDQLHLYTRNGRFRRSARSSVKTEVSGGNFGKNCL